MNTTIYNQTIVSVITKTATMHKDRVTHFLADLATGVTRRLPWIGEDLYENDYAWQLYNDIIHTIDNGASPSDALKEAIEDLDRMLKQPHNIRENSTGVFHRECSTMRYKVMLETYHKLTSLRTYAEREATSN